MRSCSATDTDSKNSMNDTWVKKELTGYVKSFDRCFDCITHILKKIVPFFSSKNSQELSLRLRNSPHHEIQCLDMICLDQK